MGSRGRDAVRPHVVLVVVLVLLGGAVGVVLASVQPSRYESTTRLVVAPPGAGNRPPVSDVASKRLIATLATLVRSAVLADVVLDQVDGDVAAGLNATSLREQVSAEEVDDAAVLEIRVLGDTPQRAEALAGAYAEALDDAASEGPGSSGEQLASVVVIDPARAEADAVGPRWLLDIGLGLAAGLLVGLVAAGVRAVSDTSFSSAHDLSAVTDVPVLASVPHQPAAERDRLITDLAHQVPHVEAFRTLRTNVSFIGVGQEHKLLVVTSAMPEDGKTSTAVNLALTLARSGVRTLLVDCDLRRPQVAPVFEIDGSAGVTTVLLGRIGLERALWEHDDSGLHVLPSGVAPPNAGELLQTQAMWTLLDGLRERYDVVVVDSPPLVPVSDTSLLAARADGVLLVVRARRTTGDQVKLALDRLTQVGVRPAGVVLNDVARSRVRQEYGSYLGKDAVRAPRRGGTRRSGPSPR